MLHISAYTTHTHTHTEANQMFKEDQASERDQAATVAVDGEREKIR